MVSMNIIQAIQNMSSTQFSSAQRENWKQHNLTKYALYHSNL